METGKNTFSYKISWFWKIVKHGSFFLGVRNRLASLGLDFMPYYLVLEEFTPIALPKIRGDQLDFMISYFGEQEMDIIQKSIKGIAHKNLKKNLEDGQTCIGMKNNTAIVAYMFIKTGDINFRGRTFQLKANEAYLKDMYTFESFRGKNIAPYLRFKSYELLKERGIDIKYSISEYFNRPTIKFKKKLNSKHLALYLSVILFRKSKWNFKLKSYS